MSGVHNQRQTQRRATPGENAWNGLLQWAPWLAFLLSVLPLPLYFLWRWLTASEEAGVYMLLALTSFGAGVVFGILAALILVLYRKSWLRRQRDRLARDGITTDELEWFIPEMTGHERRALYEVEERDPLLGDAYRETLAARLTATRVIKRAERELIATEKRFKRSARLDADGAATLREELAADRRKLEDIIRVTLSRRSEAETQLQTIEATASRSATQGEVDVALARLEAARGNAPHALETARLQQQALKEAEQELLSLEKERENASS